MSEGETPDSLEVQADELIEAMASTGMLPLEGSLEAAESVRARTIAFLEQSDRYPEERLRAFNSQDWLEAYVAEMERNPDQELITLIRITDVPDGDAPLEIREQWVGMVLFTALRDPQHRRTMSVMDPRDRKPAKVGYIVDRALAIAALRNDGKGLAADWWDELFRDRDDEESWVFDLECAEPVTLENAGTA